MLIGELVNMDLMAEMINQKYIRYQDHPKWPLRIFNYTEKAQFEKKWNSVTMTSRGLIVNTETERVLARPFEKFFNYQERQSHNLISMDEPVRVTDKMDGSLGILYKAPDYDLAIATRGSFTSDQALHATKILHSKYPRYVPPPGVTVLFEIIYPENRIVVDYREADDLFLLGGVDITTGAVLGPEYDLGWPGPKTESIYAKTFSDALRLPPRPGKEGIVIRSLMDDMMIKIKQDDYVRLHKIVTGLNKRTVWDMLRQDIDPYEGIPDEFHDWLFQVVGELQCSFIAMKNLALQCFSSMKKDLNRELGTDWTRKDFALALNDGGYEGWVKKCLFMLLDNQDIDEYLWKQLRPAGEES